MFTVDSPSPSTNPLKPGRCASRETGSKTRSITVRNKSIPLKETGKASIWNKLPGIAEYKKQPKITRGTETIDKPKNAKVGEYERTIFSRANVNEPSTMKTCQGRFVKRIHSASPYRNFSDKENRESSNVMHSKETYYNPPFDVERLSDYIIQVLLDNKLCCDFDSECIPGLSKNYRISGEELQTLLVIISDKLFSSDVSSPARLAKRSKSLRERLKPLTTPPSYSGAVKKSFRASTLPGGKERYSFYSKLECPLNVGQPKKLFAKVRTFNKFTNTRIVTERVGSPAFRLRRSIEKAMLVKQKLSKVKEELQITFEAAERRSKLREINNYLTKISSLLSTTPLRRKPRKVCARPAFLRQPRQ